MRKAGPYPHKKQELRKNEMKRRTLLQMLTVSAALLLLLTSCKGGNEGEGEVDKIEAIANENAAPVVYDLLGRRVDNPTSGIYIVNGKKVVIK